MENNRNCNQNKLQHDNKRRVFHEVHHRHVRIIAQENRAVQQKMHADKQTDWYQRNQRVESPNKKTQL
jgi:hypothetical protein